MPPYSYPDSEADSSQYGMMLNGGHILMNNMAGSRTPLRGSHRSYEPQHSGCVLQLWRAVGLMNTGILKATVKC